MGLFDNFPYTNFHELNLMWILEALKEIQTTTEQFVAINSLKYADPIQWNIVQQYEKNTIVIDPLTGTAYISVQPVPSGVALTNTDYWTVVFDLGSFVTRASKNFTDRWEDTTTLTATFPTNANDWLVWGDTLYRALVNITAGDQYVVDSNIKHFTMEEYLGHIEDLDITGALNLVDALNLVYNALLNKEGDLDDLNTTDKTNLVAAINEVLQTISNITGDRNDLTTTDKSNLVAAINENVTSISNINTRLNKARVYNVRHYGAVGDGVTDDSTAVNAALSAALTTHGILYFPAGKYLMDPITVDGIMSIRGEGSHQSLLVPNTTTEDFIKCSATGVTISELQILYETEPTSGYAITLNGYSSLVQNVSIYYPYKGILMNAGTCRVENVYIRESILYRIKTAIRVEGGDSSQIISNSALISMFDTTDNYGIDVTNNAALIISNSAVIGFQTNLRISDEVSAVYSLKVNNCYFDQGRYANIQIGSHCHRIAIYDSWIGDAETYGVDMQNVTDSELDLYNCDIVLNHTCGLNFSGNARAFINGCLIAGSITGVLVQSANNDITLIGNSFHGDDHGGNQYGIYGANTTETLVIISNDFREQTVAIAGVNISSGVKIIKSNAGYNLIGDAYYDNTAGAIKYWNGSTWIIPTNYARYNSGSSKMEYWDGTNWILLS